MSFHLTHADWLGENNPSQVNFVYINSVLLKTILFFLFPNLFFLLIDFNKDTSLVKKHEKDNSATLEKMLY